MDDALADEVEPLLRSGHESHAADDRMHEPPGDDEPLPDARIAGEQRAMPGLLGLDEIEARSQLATALRPSVFPGDRAELRTVALEQHAPDDVLEALDLLPAGIRFVNVQQVWETLGGDREQRDTGGALAVDDKITTGPTPSPTPTPEEVAPPAHTTPRVAPPQPASEAEPWWLAPARTGITLATLPLRIGAGVVRHVTDRLRR